MLAFHYRKFNESISEWMKAILIYNNVCYMLLVINASLKWHIGLDQTSNRLVFTVVEVILQSSQVGVFTLVMLKFKKIQITIDPYC